MKKATRSLQTSTFFGKSSRTQMTILNPPDPGQYPGIVKIELTPLFVPFHEIVLDAMQAGEGGLGMAIAAEEPWQGGDFVVCRLTAEDGSEGHGEVFVWLPETGVSPYQVIDAVKNGLGRYLLGESPFSAEAIGRRMDNNVARSEVAKGLLDMACYDLAASLQKSRVCDMLQESPVEKIPMAALIPLMDVAAMVDLATSFYDGGYRTFRCKTGGGENRDVVIVKSLRSALGSGINIRVDYNGAYQPDEAVSAIRAIEEHGIDFVEQPVTASDWPGMAYVQQNVGVPVMAHEGCFSMGDIRALHAMGAIGVVGINSERPGGVTRALEAIGFAKENGLGIVLHNQTLGIAAAMHLHVAAARSEDIQHATELFGHVMYEDDLIVDPIDYDGGIARVPEGDGWGVRLDESALDKYATGPTVIISP
jgi:muconate cycloisomerase